MNSEETKPCPCGKRMVGRFTGMMFAADPPLFGREWMCFGCGLRLDAPSIRHEIQSDRTRWERAQGPPPEDRSSLAVRWFAGHCEEMTAARVADSVEVRVLANCLGDADRVPLRVTVHEDAVVVLTDGGRLVWELDFTDMYADFLADAANGGKAAEEDQGG